MFTKPTDAQMANRYLHHAPKNDAQIEKYNLIRAKVLELAVLIRDQTPLSAEQTRAFNALDETMFLAVAAVARNE